MILLPLHSSSSQDRLKPYGYLYLDVILLLVFISNFAIPCHASCNQLDRDSLLSFTLNISSTPSPLNWSAAVNCCLWEGIACDSNDRVISLWLPLRGLRGSISPSIANLSSLSRLNLSHNWLSGPLPDELFTSLNSLEIIDLSYNLLSGQLLSSDRLPDNIQTVDLSSNHFNGTIQFSFLLPAQNLITLNVSNNSFAGPLPTSICINSPSVQFLDFSFNEFSDQIPQGLGGCSKLEVFRAGFNSLSGLLHHDIFNAGALQEISLPVNRLSGTIGDGIVKLTNLRILELFGNQLTGVVPQDIGKLSNLERLLLHINNLNGPLPPSLMNCTNLTTLNLRVNFFEGELSTLDFSKLLQLSTIDLGNNNFTGRLPESLFSLTNISAAIRILMGCKNLSTVILSKNFQNEEIPDDGSIANLKGFQNLQVLGLGGCNFTGQIPTWLAKLWNLEVLDLSFNQIVGSIPGWLVTLPNLIYIDLSVNFLWGDFPTELTRLRRLASEQGADQVARSYLGLPVFVQRNNASNLQYNQLSNLPPAIYLRNNSLSGNIPVEIGQLKFIHVLDLSGIMHPSTPKKNPKKKIIVGLVLGICFGIAFTLTMLALWILSKRRILPRGDTNKIDLDTNSFNSNSGISNTSLVIIFPNNTDEIKDLTISEVLKATDNFNQANIIGCGGFGLVYKATLANGTKMAVKKLSGDMGLMEREFKAEVEALSTAQHKNLVSLQGYCVHDGFRLLIYSYMENGSLDYWLHEKTDGASQLAWPIRLRIAQGASCGLAYMHQICEPHIVHRDIKSSNILLDDKFEAHVADFGLSRLILPSHTHVTTELVGTLGYIPPEYGQAWIATLRGDVYSFGVVMLELLTGKRPVEVGKPKVSRELVVWVQQMRSEGKQDEVFDPLLRGKGFEEEMLQVLDVACMCVNQNPFKRPTIKEVVDWLKNVGSNRETP
ncbi:hypothetical protein F0562_024248 [Nyssa sinensis]|uniref:non-specific serine/threonine protein kinase n=1 Tax=Nyssa sinensis TaxID=561372 RepID=A0A5J5BBU5_9ASTE|nr:hypothetical protein F0562_024248 [Nyssa sinensis]